MDKQSLINYFDTIALERDYWKGANIFYYEYIESFVEFIVPKGKKVLEVGAGTGSLISRLGPSEGLGIDISANMVTKAKERGHTHIEFKTAEIKEVSGEYDYIVISDVLGYVDDVEDVFRHAKEKLRVGGRIVITQYSVLWEPILRLASKLKLRQRDVNQNWLSGSDLKNFSELAGLETVKSGTKILIPIYIPLVSAFFNKILANIFPFSRIGLFHFVVLRKKSENISSPSLSIVVPARNEKGTIEKIAEELPQLGNFTEIIFIEGNSTDGTFDEIKRVAEKYKDSKKISFAKQDGIGKGDAVRKGFAMATGDILAIYDADMTVPAEEVHKFYRALVEDRGDFINGSRLIYPLEKQSMRFLNFFGNKFFSMAFSYILGTSLKDTLCGTKVLWRKDYEDIKRGRKFFGNFDPFGDFDLLFGAAKLNRKIVDMPIHYKERVYGETNISRFRHGALLLKMVLFAARKIKFI